MMLRLKERLASRSNWIYGGIFLATLLAYLPALRGGFIWDDNAHVTKPELQSWAGLGRIWGQLGATQQYYPVLHSAFWFEHRLWGEAPLGYHLLNVLLHATSACLFVALLRKLWSGSGNDRAEKAALLAGLIFALHPVGVESVAWASEQKNTLSTVFYLLAALSYLRFAGMEAPPARPSLGAYGLASALFLLALLSKSVTATLPAALLVVLWWKRGRLTWRDVLPLLPWLALGLGMGLFTAWLERNYLGAEGASFGLSLGERGLLAGRVLCFYLGKLFWPKNLIFIYPHWRVSAAVGWQYLFPLAILALLAGLWAGRRRTRGPLAGFLFYAGTLFPALGFFNVFPFQFSYVADHFQYLASLGVIAVVAAGWGRLAPGQVRSALAAAVLLVLGLLTWRQGRMYRDAETLYRTTLARNPDCWLMAYNLGVVLDGEGRVPEAMAEYRRSLVLNPDLSDAHNNLAVALANAGQSDAALAEYRAAIAIDEKEAAGATGPGKAAWYRGEAASALCNLGNLLGNRGRPAEAEACYRQALKLKPDSDQAYVALGRALADSGQSAQAILALRRAVRARPGNAGAHNDLGVALQAAGRQDEAAEEFAAALRAQPDFAEAAMNLGNIRREQHRLPEAVAALQEALRVRPDYPEAEAYLGVALTEANRAAEALPHFEAGYRARLADPHLNYLLGLAFRDLNRFPEALESFRRALRAQPAYPEAENDLGIAIAEGGRPAEAIAHFEAALRLRPEFGEAENNLGQVLVALGRTEEGQAHLAHARALGAGAPAPP